MALRRTEGSLGVFSLDAVSPVLAEVHERRERSLGTIFAFSGGLATTLGLCSSFGLLDGLALLGKQ